MASGMSGPIGVNELTQYSYIWAFQARAGRIEEFLSHYERAGTWAQLLRRAPGFLGTRLLRDQNDPLRFVTVDDWESEQHYPAFRTRFSLAYEALDRNCTFRLATCAPLR